MNESGINQLSYTLKIIAGILLSYLTNYFVHQIDYTWCLISVILVLSPEAYDALNLAITRIKANFIGAGIGFLFLVFPISNPLNLIVGATLSLSLCYLFKLNDGAKSTLAALVIILLYQNGNDLAETAWQRLCAVIAGCLIGLLVSLIFHSFSGGKSHQTASKTTEREA